MTHDVRLGRRSRQALGMPSVVKKRYIVFWFPGTSVIGFIGSLVLPPPFSAAATSAGLLYVAHGKKDGERKYSTLVRWKYWRGRSWHIVTPFELSFYPK